MTGQNAPACVHAWQPVADGSWAGNERGYRVLERCQNCQAERMGDLVPFDTLERVRVDLGRREE